MMQRVSVGLRLTIVIFGALVFGFQPLVGQERADDAWIVPRTADGQADLQGV